MQFILRVRTLGVPLLLASAVAACSAKPMTALNCGPVFPIQQVFLANPAPEATGIPDTIGSFTTQ